MKNNKQKLDMIISVINSLSSHEKDKIYRHLWKEYVKDDAFARCQEIEDIDDIKASCIASYVADDYVYGCEYDCNLSYWENIDNLIEDRLSTYEED